MRNLNECQAEIFRRSEERIKARRRKKRVLAACVPSVLCLTLISVFFLPGLLPERSADSVEPALPESAAGCIPDSIEKITVYGPDFSKTYLEFSQVHTISSQLKTYSSANEMTEESLRGENFKENSYTGIADRTDAEYTIFMTTEDGKSLNFLFSGNTLTNLATKESYALSQQQVTELYDLLGIPQP